MSAADKDVIRYASDSGFPFQIATQHAVLASAKNTGWSVRYVEHGWKDPTSDNGGFIDLVLHHRRHSCSLVVECKRQREATWVFMHQTGSATVRRHFKAWVTEDDGANILRHEWANTTLEPEFAEANFCAVRGQNSNEKNTLIERTAAELVAATEAFAESERDFRKSGIASTRMYFPLIVTTAQLKLLEFEPKDIALRDGELSKAKVHEIPCVRFRKQLSSRFSRASYETNAKFGDPSYNLENSVFVVEAEALIQFLYEFQPPDWCGA